MASIDELWIVDFGDPFPGEPANIRPALVVGPPDVLGADLPFVIVCPLTTVDREIRIHVEVEPLDGTGLDSISYVQCEQVRSIGVRRLRHRIGAVAPDVSAAVESRVRLVFGY